jgi:hypothetical protein
METRPIGRIVRLHAPVGRRQAAVDPPNGLHHWGQSGKPRDGQKFFRSPLPESHRRLSS